MPVKVPSKNVKENYKTITKIKRFLTVKKCVIMIIIQVNDVKRENELRYENSLYYLRK